MHLVNDCLNGLREVACGKDAEVIDKHIRMGGADGSKAKQDE